MLMFEAEGQPGLVPDINFSESVQDLQFDLDLNNILSNDTFPMKTPKSSMDWNGNGRKFSFSDISDDFSTPSQGSTTRDYSTLGASSVNVKEETDMLLNSFIKSEQQARYSPEPMAHAAIEGHAENISHSTLRKPAGPRLAGKTKGRKSKSTVLCTDDALDTNGLLPVNHKPARGRGRQNQLAKMTKEQIEAEADARLEKNRQAARDCRLRRKQHTKFLEQKLAQLEKEKKAQDKLIRHLQAQLASQKS